MVRFFTIKKTEDLYGPLGLSLNRSNLNKVGEESSSDSESSWENKKIANSNEDELGATSDSSEEVARSQG